MTHKYVTHPHLQWVTLAEQAVVAILSLYPSLYLLALFLREEKWGSKRDRKNMNASGKHEKAAPFWRNEVG